MGWWKTTNQIFLVFSWKVWTDEFGGTFLLSHHVSGEFVQTAQDPKELVVGRLTKKPLQKIQAHLFNHAFRKEKQGSYPLVFPNIAGWKIPIFNREYIFNKSIFHCHVSLLEGTQVDGLESATMIGVSKGPIRWFDRRNCQRRKTHGRWSGFLGGGFKYFLLCSFLPREMIQFD